VPAGRQVADEEDEQPTGKASLTPLEIEFAEVNSPECVLWPARSLVTTSELRQQPR